MKDSQRTPEMFKRGCATAGMVITFQVLAVVCLWSLMAFLQRHFPSRPDKQILHASAQRTEKMKLVHDLQGKEALVNILLS
ncbi:hypothetical protein Goari_009245 [Gossypium aridum]|uniref:Uncharacterized protein n=1 Tax=Gossypium aridum TaxID=34290 RepID=A0A7J8XWF1_GOSAI|nr:hypothetical protein [Gossypium aridum]